MTELFTPDPKESKNRLYQELEKPLLRLTTGAIRRRSAQELAPLVNDSILGQEDRSGAKTVAAPARPEIDVLLDDNSVHSELVDVISSARESWSAMSLDFELSKTGHLPDEITLGRQAVGGHGTGKTLMAGLVTDMYRQSVSGTENSQERLTRAYEAVKSKPFLAALLKILGLIHIDRVNAIFLRNFDLDPFSYSSTAELLSGRSPLSLSAGRAVYLQNIIDQHWADPGLSNGSTELYGCPARKYIQMDGELTSAITSIRDYVAEGTRDLKAFEAYEERLALYDLKAKI